MNQLLKFFDKTIFLKLYLKGYLYEISTRLDSWLSRYILRILTYSLKVMKIRQIIVMVQTFGHFDRINFLKLISVISGKTLNLVYRDETYVLLYGHETCKNYYD